MTYTDVTIIRIIIYVLFKLSIYICYDNKQPVIMC